MTPNQLQALGNKSLAGTGGIAASSYANPVIDFFESMNNFVGVYYDTLFIFATFAGLFISSYFYYKSYKLKKELHDEEMKSIRKIYSEE